MPGQIFDDGGQQYSMADGSGLASSIVELPPTPPPETVPPQIVTASGQDSFAFLLNAQHAARLRLILHPKLLRIENWTYTWAETLAGWQGNWDFPNQNRSAQVRLMKVPVLILRLDAERTWNGIGGVFYIPSFPQLSRQETTWPHAT